MKSTYCSVDISDCRLQEPVLFDSKWFIHKFNGPGVRYKIDISNICCLLVEVKGCFCFYKKPNIKIFERVLSHILLFGERGGGERIPISSMCYTKHFTCEGEDSPFYTVCAIRDLYCAAKRF